VRVAPARGYPHIGRLTDQCNFGHAASGDHLAVASARIVTALVGQRRPPGWIR